jgi:hypothetical protein
MSSQCYVQRLRNKKVAAHICEASLRSNPRNLHNRFLLQRHACFGRNVHFTLVNVHDTPIPLNQHQTPAQRVRYSIKLLMHMRAT